MRLSRREWLAALPFAGRVAGQDPAVSFSAEVGLINLFATVRDQQGRVVRGLSKDDFELFEDERRQTIRHFSPETGVPLRIGLVADVSGSMLKRIADERTVARRFFRQVLRPQKDLAFFVRFDSAIELLQRATADSHELDRAADEVGRRTPWARHRLLDRACGGGTSAVRDAVVAACREVLAKEGGRKALILMSDGMDQGSCAPLRLAVEAAQRADTIIYTMLFLESNVRREWITGLRGRPLMQQLAERTGGRMFLPGIEGNAAKAFATIEEDLRHQYSIGYTSDRPSPGFHQLRLATRQGHTVQTRAGYYGR